MRWIIYVITVFLISNLLVIGYWRDSNINLTLSSILFFMVLLPLILIALTFLTILTYKKIIQPKQENELVGQPSPTLESSESKELIDEPKISGFKVYATALQSSEGSDAIEIIEALKSHKSAELDPELVGADGVSLITRRIDLDDGELDSIDHILDNSMHSLEHHDASIKRMTMIYQRLFESLSIELVHLSQGMAQFNSWRIQPAVTSNVLHPAWADSNTKNPNDEKYEITDMVANMQQWPTKLYVCYFIPDRLSEEQNDLINDYIHKILVELGFKTENFILNVYYTGENSSNYQQLDIIQKLADNNSNTVFLVMGADSDIDQDYIEELMWTNNNYIPSEFGYAILLTHDQVSIPELTPVNYLSDSFSHLFNITDYKLNKKYQEKIDQLVTQWLAIKKIDINEAAHFISNIHPSLDYKELPVLNSVANNLNIEPEQILLASTLIENTNYQAVGFSWVLASALSKNLSGTAHILYLRDQEQLLLCLLSDEPDGIIDTGYADKTNNNPSSDSSLNSNFLKIDSHAAS